MEEIEYPSDADLQAQDAEQEAATADERPKSVNDCAKEMLQDLRQNRYRPTSRPVLQHETETDLPF